MQTRSWYIWAEEPQRPSATMWNAYHSVFSLQTWQFLGRSLVPSWQRDSWFPNYTCKVPRGSKAMSFGTVGTSLSTSPITVKDTGVYRSLRSNRLWSTASIVTVLPCRWALGGWTLWPARPLRTELVLCLEKQFSFKTLSLLLLLSTR